MHWRCAVILLPIFASPALAVELRPAPVDVTNKGTAPIACVAQLAHWFSTGLGTAEPGETLRIPLRLEPSTRTYVLLNVKNDHMPVEALWCGIAGKAYETRAAIERGQTEVSCAGTGRLVCN